MTTNPEQKFKILCVVPAWNEAKRIGSVIRSVPRDVVQGSRFLEGGQFIHPPIHRRFGTSLYTLLFSILANKRVSDASCGLRAFRTRAVQGGLFLATGLKK